MTELLSSGPNVRWPELLKILDGDDVASMLGRLLAHGEQLLPATGLSLWLPGPVEPVVHATTEVAAGLDRLQAAVGEGPAHDAATQAVVVAADVLAGAKRWPRFAQAAADAGVRCTTSVPLLRVDNSCAGVLSAYSGDVLPESSTPVLSAMGAHASVIVETVGIYLHARGDAARLQDAMLINSVIEQAKGVLIMRERISAELADEYLRKTSEVTRREIRDIAAELVSRAAKGTLR